MQRVIFAGQDASGAYGSSGLWLTDGTAAGTTELAVAGASSGGLDPYGFTAFNGRVLFQGQDTGGNHGLWITDGTAAGTAELPVAGASTTAFDPNGFTVLGSRALFDGQDANGLSGLWATDGTAAGTPELPVAGASATYGLSPSGFVAYNHKLLFTGIGADDRTGLWVTDGTAAGTAELHPSNDPGFDLLASGITLYNGKALFSAPDENDSFSLWVTDGTSAGTTELAVANANSFGLYPSGLTVFNGRVLFEGQDSTYGNYGLWATDGTAAGTAELAVAGSSTYGLHPRDFTVVNGRVLFQGLDASDQYRLWTTDGTAAGTVELQVPGAANSYSPVFNGFTALNGRVVFEGIDANGQNNLWVSNGTSAGTTELAVAGADSTFGLQPTGFTPLNGKLLFRGQDSSFHSSLWVTDGTAAGTTELSVSGAGSYGLQPADLTLVSFGAPAAISAVQATPSAGGVLGAGRTVSFVLTPSAAVTISTAGGRPALALNDGGTAAYAGQDAGGRLLFGTTVAPGQNAADLKVTGLALNGGSITDANGSALDLSALASLPGSDTGIAVDAVAPTIVGTAGAAVPGANPALAPFGTLAVTGQLVSGGAASVAGQVVTLLANGTVLTTAAPVVTDAQGRFNASVTLPGLNTVLLAQSQDSAGNTASTAAVVSSHIDAQLFGTAAFAPGSTLGQVYALHEAILGQAPDAATLAGEANAVTGGTTMVGLAQQLLSSAQYTAEYGAAAGRSASDFVTTLYQDAAGRNPDPGGLQNWTALLAGGATQAQVAAAIGLSPESIGHAQPAFGTYGTVFVPSDLDASVARLYYGVLGRTPDAAGLQSLEAEAAQGWSLEDLVSNALASPEYRASFGTPSNAQFVAELYQNTVNRAPDPGQGWTAMLDAGASRASIALQIIQSPEARTDMASQIELGFRVA